MRTVNRIELFAKPEVKSALEEVRNVARRALPDGDFGEREADVLAIFEEAGRVLLEEDLQAIADGLDERVLVDGIEHKRHEPGTVKYYCLSGALRVRRHTYRRADVRNGPTVVPLDVIAGLAERATPALAYNVAHGYAQHDVRLHGESLEAAHRTPPRRATLERMAKRLATAVNCEHRADEGRAAHRCRRGARRATHPSMRLRLAPRALSEAKRKKT